MSLMSRYRLQFLIAWLAMDASTRVALSPRSLPAVQGMLGQARAMQQALHPWLEAVLARREHLSWTLHPPTLPDELARRVQDALALEPYDLRDLRRWSASWLRYLLAGELARLVWLLEAPTLLMTRPGWEHWEVSRWALATCLVRISQLTRLLAQRQPSAPPAAGLNAALQAVWPHLVANHRQGAA